MGSRPSSRGRPMTPGEAYKYRPDTPEPVAINTKRPDRNYEALIGATRGMREYLKSGAQPDEMLQSFKVRPVQVFRSHA